jgi:hypothetical protein
MPVPVYKLHPRATPDHVGVIPYWLDEEDPRPARDQLNEKYAHGGGWRPFEGFKMGHNLSIKYPGDPAHPPLAIMKMRNETVVVYEHAWVAIIQEDKSFEICRMD